MSQQTTVELVHGAILRDAADIANQQIESDPVLQELARPRRPAGKTRFDPASRKQFFSGSVFRPDPTRSNLGGLALSMDEGMKQLPEPTLQRLQQIGRDAIKQSIVKNQRAFVAVILAEARAGRNYSDRFGTDNTPLPT